MDWPVHYRKGVTEQQLSGTQNWHQQDASASSYANASVHTSPTPAAIPLTPQEYKPYPDVSLKHDELYVREWEFDYEQPIFDAENNNAKPPNSYEIPVHSDLSTEEMRNTPGTAHECSRETFPQTEELSDVTDTYPNMEPNVEISSEQLKSSPTNPRSSKYNLRHNPKPNCNDDYRH